MSLIRFCILSHYALPIWHIKMISRFSILQLLCRIDINLNIISQFSELHETIEFVSVVCSKIDGYAI